MLLSFLTAQEISRCQHMEAHLQEEKCSFLLQVKVCITQGHGESGQFYIISLLSVSQTITSSLTSLYILTTLSTLTYILPCLHYSRSRGQTHILCHYFGTLQGCPLTWSLKYSYPQTNFVIQYICVCQVPERLNFSKRNYFKALD